MDIKEFYAEVGGNADDVLIRLMNETLVKKFVFKFLDDPSFEMLRTAFAARDLDTAFRAAHTLKGVCRNIGLGKLGDLADKLTEMLRNGFHGNMDELTALYDALATEYISTTAAIKKYKGE